MDFAPDTPARIRVDRLSGITRYGGAFLVVVLATGVWDLSPLMHRDPFAIFVLGVVFTAHFLGFGPAVFSTVLSVLAIDYVALTPRLSFSLQTADLTRLAIFVFISLLAASLAKQKSRAQLRADEARERMAAIVASSGDAIYSATLDGIITSWNHGAEQLYGYPADEAIGQHLSLTVPADRIHETRSHLELLGRGEIIESFRTQRRRKDGSLVDVLVSVSPVRDNTGKVIGASGIVRDITLEMRAEEALRRSEKLATAGRLTAAIAHEINNPLEAITNLLYLARRDPARAPQHLDMAEREVHRISDIAQQTLGFVRELSQPCKKSFNSIPTSSFRKTSKSRRNSAKPPRSMASPANCGNCSPTCWSIRLRPCRRTAACACASRAHASQPAAAKESASCLPKAAAASGPKTGPACSSLSIPPRRSPAPGWGCGWSRRLSASTTARSACAAACVRGPAEPSFGCSSRYTPTAARRPGPPPSTQPRNHPELSDNQSVAEDLPTRSAPSVPPLSSPANRIIEANCCKDVVLADRSRVDPLLAAASVLMGLIFGSFLNVCVYRLPRSLSVLNPRWSACPHCQAPIAFYDNIPVLSWLLLRGRCRKCQQPISPRYLLLELLTAGLFLACAWHFGPTLAMLKYCTLAFLLVGLIFTDAETKLLPDKLTLTGLGLGILFSLFVPVNDLASQFLPGVVSVPLDSNLSARLFSLLDSLLGAAIGSSFIYGAGAIYLRARGIEGMGFGDVKLMAMIGAL